MKKKKLSADELLSNLPIQNIGARIRLIRLSLNLNQEPFAEELNKKYNDLYPDNKKNTPFDRTTIGKWESGRTTPDIKTLYAIAAMTEEYDIGFVLGLYKQSNYNVFYIQNITGLQMEDIWKLEELNKEMSSGDVIGKKYATIIFNFFSALLNSEVIAEQALGLSVINDLDFNSMTKNLLLEATKFKIQKETSEIINKVVEEVNKSGIN